MNKIIFNVPNSIGHFRLALIAICGVCQKHYPLVSFNLYLLSVGLDFIDGAIARKLNQCTKYGEWLDQVTDSIGTTLQYCLLCYAINPLCIVWCGLISIDWIYRVNMATSMDKYWKTDRKKSDNVLVEEYFRNNFSNPIGYYGCISNQLFPAVLLLIWNAPKVTTTTPFLYFGSPFPKGTATTICFSIVLCGFILRTYCEPYYHIKKTIIGKLQHDQKRTS